jgi:hypothetical protein
MTDEPRAAARPGATGKPAAASGPGSPGDFVDPFTNALLEAAKAATKEPVGDPDIIAAFKLGWLMGEILAGRHAPPVASILASDPSAVYAAQGLQLTALVTQLKVGESQELTALETALRHGPASEQAEAFEPKLLTALLGAHTRFAKAYGLARQLDELTHEEQLPKDRFARDDVKEMLALLDDLSTGLPPHAARGVANSIRRWRGHTGLPQDSAALLTVQGQLWRTVLAGDKKATELLEPQNYLDAAERLAGKFGQTALAELRRHMAWVALIVVLFVGGIALLLVTPKHAGGTAAGLSAVLAALGLTWKGLGGTLGVLAGKLEAPLWGAELDGAVTDAVTLIRTPPTQAPPKEGPDRDYAGRSARPILGRGAASPSSAPRDQEPESRA